MKLKEKTKYGYPHYWTDLIGEISCGVSFMSNKYVTYYTLISWKPFKTKKGKRQKNCRYIPLKLKNKNCTKHLGLDCIGCPFALISEARPKMIKHIKKFYKNEKIDKKTNKKT